MTLAIPLLITLGACQANQIKPDPFPVFIYKASPIQLPVVVCKPEPAVPPLLTTSTPRPKDTDALLWTEDTRVAGEDCRSGVVADKNYQDGYNKNVDDFNAKAEAEAKKLGK